MFKNFKSNTFTFRNFKLVNFSTCQVKVYQDQSFLISNSRPRSSHEFYHLDFSPQQLFYPMFPNLVIFHPDLYESLISTLLNRVFFFFNSSHIHFEIFSRILSSNVKSYFILDFCLIFFFDLAFLNIASKENNKLKQKKIFDIFHKRT